MNPRLPLVRWLAATILAIVAWAAASPAGAHAAHGHHRAPPVAAQAASGQVAASFAARVALPRASVLPAGRSAVEAIASLRSGGGDRVCCAGPHGLCCCGAACCAPGILAAAVTLPGPNLGRVVLRPGDAAAPAGLGPASLTEPPRPLA